ncbi:MAG: hypothetical protein ACLQVD_14230 [Capsulimonadaceae bacterium]
MSSRTLKFTAVFAAVLVLCLAAPARADMGTPLMYAGMFHLAFANAFIGLFESVIVQKAFRDEWRHLWWSSILANYLSAWVGWILLNALWLPFQRVNDLCG